MRHIIVKAHMRDGSVYTNKHSLRNVDENEFEEVDLVVEEKDAERFCEMFVEAKRQRQLEEETE
ncbi:hypothetical protein ACH0BF_20305 [Pseudobacillus sp. 179-B 2D1 NHS]|uniref:hypothetical protein n=1 Tax=Pseudobacillus sp. 179-B 2D1 NHS TaxID=3374292 RepID=UPI003879B350